MESKKHITARNYLMTYNNPEEDTKEFLEKLHKGTKATYTCGLLEKGENGTPHIQFFMNFKNSVRPSVIKKLNNKLHIEVVKVNNGAHDYCMKEDTRLEGPFEFGTKPVQRNNKTDWDEVRENAKAGNFDAVPSEIYIKHYLNLKRIHLENLEAPSFEECRGIWLWGPPGTGKTTYARTEFSDDIFIKALNKWWDGYKGLKYVILDDLDTDCLSHYIKIWADKWSATGEIKGGTVALQYEKFIVTSNYSIEDLFAKLNQQMVEAIKRRFKVTHFNKPLGQ